MPSPDVLRDRLERLLVSPIGADLINAAGRAVELTRAEQADRLVEVGKGPAIPAGTLVELWRLDDLVDGPAPRAPQEASEPRR